MSPGNNITPGLFVRPAQASFQLLYGTSHVEWAAWCAHVLGLVIARNVSDEFGNEAALVLIDNRLWLITLNDLVVI
jgi:hypothetical protein